MEGFDFNNIAEGNELNPSAYNPDDYSPKEIVLDFISLNCNNPPVNIDLKSLSRNGTVKRDPMELYLQSKSISSSNLKNALQTPRSFYYDWERVFEEKQRPCFQLGTFAHMAFLEPRLFELVKVEPSFNQASKDGVLSMIGFYEGLLKKEKDYCKNAEDEIPCEKWNFNALKDYRDDKKQKLIDLGYSFINEDMFMVIEALKKNYYWYGNGIIPQLLKGAYSEVSFYGKDEETGLDVRVRPDYFNIEENIGVNAVISFKTTRADDLGKFYYDCAKLKYELSEGMYQEVMSSITGRNFNVTFRIPIMGYYLYYSWVNEAFRLALVQEIPKHEYDDLFNSGEINQKAFLALGYELPSIDVKDTRKNVRRFGKGEDTVEVWEEDGEDVWLEHWTEDFLDEDSGEVVPIQRHEWHRISIEVSPWRKEEENDETGTQEGETEQLSAEAQE